ncbi:hypothetical protein J1N35_015544 [Gossypium stocksii]|uniref:Uncharacterized protein n=1 Tax=Gossypium stocksii TaxID=47602 RepID=A0A9D3VXD6_9ROSI|nr:hypothetical protein J1N35_015544 [Gossypium stocksii]
MERDLADLSLKDGEDEAFSIPVEDEAQSSAYSFCLDIGNGNGLGFDVEGFVEESHHCKQHLAQGGGRDYFFFGKKCFEQQFGPSSRHNHGRGSWTGFNPALRINLEGSKFANVSNQRQDSRQFYGKELTPYKSQQMRASLNVGEIIRVLANMGVINQLDSSQMEDSLEINGGHLAHLKQLSAATSGYADWKK